MSALPLKAPPGHLKLILGLAMLALALLPATGAAKAPPPPAQQLDTATATGSAGPGVSHIDVDVHSGPSGENPGGGAAVGGCCFEAHGQSFPLAVFGPASCLNVKGNTAVIRINATLEIVGIGTFAYGPVSITLQDNGGSGSDRFGFNLNPRGDASDCSSADATGPLDGRAVVFDAQPLPTDKAQCKGGGWQQYGFANQGQCMKFVNHG